MLVLITYDVNTETSAGKRRLRQVAKLCVDHGQRVQHSVFECLLDQAQLTRLTASLCAVIDEKTDSLRFYLLGDRYQTRIKHFGAKAGYDPEGPLIILRLCEPEANRRSLGGSHRFFGIFAVIIVLFGTLLC